MTGWIATVSASTTATSEMSTSTINDYATSVAEFYGVEPSDVVVSTAYESTGSLTLTIPDDLSEDELTDAVIASLAESLGVHPQDVGVTVDMETGEVDFVITSDTFGDAASIAFDLDNYQYQDDITESIQNALPLVTVDTFEPSAEVTASLEFTIDANDADNDLTQAAWQSEQLLSDFDVTIESTTFFYYK